jgi:serine/threonine protein kinase
MINGEPPFLGDSQIDQLIEIIKIMGTPKKE